MGSLVSKEQYKTFLLRLIKATDLKELKELEEILTDPQNISVEYPTSPGTPNLDSIESAGEKAFQRALLNSKHSYLKYRKDSEPEKVMWLDLELPVSFSNKARRRCIDLIGVMEDTPIICELKYLEVSKSNHPVYAIYELLTYYYLIQCNYRELDSNNVHHQLPLPKIKWESLIKNFSTQLLVAANKSYWDYWFERVNKKDLIELLFLIIKELDVNLHLFLTPDEDFIKQKNNKKSYKPFILSTDPWIKVKI